jgi:hypothetical protein
MDECSAYRGYSKLGHNFRETTVGNTGVTVYFEQLVGIIIIDASPGKVRIIQAQPFSFFLSQNIEPECKMAAEGDKGFVMGHVNLGQRFGPEA